MCDRHVVERNCRIVLKNHNMKKSILFILIAMSNLFFTVGNCYAQQQYTTMNGYVLVTGFYGDSAFLAESHQLEFIYNPVTQNISGDIDVRSFKSGIEKIDSILAKKSNHVTIKGHIPVDFLSWDHDEYDLNIPAEFTFQNHEIETPVNMKIKHVDKAFSFTCILELSFDLDMEKFDLVLPPGVDPNINVQFLQLILRKLIK